MSKNSFWIRLVKVKFDAVNYGRLKFSGGIFFVCIAAKKQHPLLDAVSFLVQFFLSI